MKCKYVFLLLLISGFFVSCERDLDVLDNNPYEGGKTPLGIKFGLEKPTPERAFVGDLVTFQVEGLSNYHDSYTFFINEEEVTEVAELTDSTITVRVPDLVSSGGASIQIGEQMFYGPRLIIRGNINIDQSTEYSPGFTWKVGDFNFSATVTDYLQVGTNRYFVGQFSDYNEQATVNQSINAMVRTALDGKYDATFAPVKGGLGNFAYVGSITRTDLGKLIVSGNFGEYGGRTYVNNIARLNANGSLDTEIIRVINPTPIVEWKNSDTIPTFNANFVEGNIVKHMMQQVGGEEKIVVVGSFKSYFKYRYDARPTYDFKNRSYTDISYLARLDADGSLDSTYNFDLVAGKGKTGPNGSFYDAAIYNNEIYVVGSFTTHNGASAGRIAKLTESGDVDPTFAANIGSGANGNIFSISIDQNKIVLAGAFTTFNGHPYMGVVILNMDGTIDESFQMRSLEGGVVRYAKLLSNGKVLVSGSFNKYDNVQRGGLLLLEGDGAALQRYNTLGDIQGTVHNAFEGTSALGKFQITLMGYITKVGEQLVNGIVAVELD